MPKANHPEDSRLIAGVQRFQPILCKAKLAGKNESDTVTIIVDMLSEVFGFDKYEQITSELQIKRTFCDLAIKIDGKVCLLIECKAVGVDLKEDHVSQATGYAANYGIDYVALTNGLSWSVYRVLFEKPVEITPVCSFEFCDLNVNRPGDLVPLRCLCVEAFQGGENKLLDQTYSQRSVLNKYIVGQLLLNDWMVQTIRRSLERHFPTVKVADDDVRRVLHDEVFRHEIVEGDRAEDAAKIVLTANNRMKQR